MSSSVEKIKERLSITDVVSSYLKLEKAGQNYKAPCPFHNEKTPSFFISPGRGSFYCFGCGAKGDIFSFVEQFEGLDFKGALKVLADRAGVELEPYRGTDPKEKSEKDRLYELMAAASFFYERELEKNTEAQQYLGTRGVTKETIAAFHIGFAPSEWRALANAMRAKGFTDTELLSAGLAKRPDDKPQGEIYDRFRDRVMFPISDTGGRVIAFSGRILHQADLPAQAGGAASAKYINSPETPIFKKGSTLYGLDKAKFDIRKRDQAILVEGQMDLVLSHQAGFTNTVASSGTALGDSLVADHDRGLLSGLGQVRALSNNLVIAFDADKAGLRAAGRAEKIGLSLGMNVKVAKLPKDMDPADVIRTEGAPAWKKIVDESQHIILVYLSVLLEHPLSEITRVRAVRDRILPYVAVMPSAVERAHFLREIHRKTGIPEEALMEDLVLLMAKEQPRTVAQSPAEAPATMRPRGARIEDRIAGVLFWQETLSAPVIDLQKFKSRLESILGNERYTNLLSMSAERKNECIFEAEFFYDNPDRLVKEADELLDNIEEDALSIELDAVMREFGEAERRGDQSRTKELLSRSSEITKRVNTIKSSRFSNN